MTARIIFALVFGPAVLVALVARVMEASILAGTILASALVGLAMLYTAYRLIATGPGQRCAPRGWAEASERIALPCERVITPAAVEGRPPWEDQPEPDGYFIAAGTVTGGRLTSVRAAVLPPLPDWADDEPPPAAPEPADDSAWTRGHVKDVWALLRAEAVGSDG